MNSVWGLLLLYFYLLGQPTPRDAPRFPPHPILFRCVAQSLSLSLPSHLSGCLALLIWLPFFSSLLRIYIFCHTRVIFNLVVFCVFIFVVFCFLVFSSESLLGDDDLYRLLSRPFPSVSFLSCFFFFLCNLLCLVTTATNTNIKINININGL